MTSIDADLMAKKTTDDDRGYVEQDDSGAVKSHAGTVSRLRRQSRWRALLSAASCLQGDRRDLPRRQDQIIVAVARVEAPLAFPDLFHPAVNEWLAEAFAGPTRAQALGWPEIVAGRSTLILAPTGSGKTLAAFLAAIDRLMFSPVPEKLARCRVLYISPLRALAFDVERNLRAPLAGIARVAERRGDAVHLPTVALRTGDTDAGERARMRRTPPDILITTPESLYLMLTSQARRDPALGRSWSSSTRSTPWPAPSAAPTSRSRWSGWATWPAGRSSASGSRRRSARWRRSRGTWAAAK